MIGGMSSQPAEYPPPTLVRVGVTGHRTKGLSQAGYNPEVLSQSVREVLTQVKKVAQDALSEPLLRVVSPLAEGADRVVAEEALALGYSLQSPLPFPRHEYERDFSTPESRVIFNTLLGRASEVVELAGSRNDANAAYEAVGRWVLLHSDILIAIWNGKPAAGQGGTGQIVQEALAERIATVWVRPHDPISLIKSTNPLSSVSIDQLSEVIRRALTARS
jgi:hypothetical protein